jgi:hypothetical protein
LCFRVPHLMECPIPLASSPKPGSDAVGGGPSSGLIYLRSGEQPSDPALPSLRLEHATGPTKANEHDMHGGTGTSPHSLLPGIREDRARAGPGKREIDEMRFSRAPPVDSFSPLACAAAESNDTLVWHTQVLRVLPGCCVKYAAAPWTSAHMPKSIHTHSISEFSPTSARCPKKDYSQNPFRIGGAEPRCLSGIGPHSWEEVFLL